MRVAYFSPLSPKCSGIADYSETLLPHLARHCKLEVFIEDYTPASQDLQKLVRIRHWREFEEEHARGHYDAVLYHVGNNPQHVYIYDLAVRFPGVVVLHEFNLHYLLADVTITRNNWEGYLRELEYNAGPVALDHARKVLRVETEPEYDRIPMNRRLLENSQAAIVHSQYMVGLVCQAGFRLPLARIPHGVAAPRVDPQQARARLGLDHELLIGAFGFLKPYKRIHSAIHALARLRRAFPDTHLLLVGEEHPQYPLRPLIQRLGLEDCVRLLGFVPLEDFLDYVAACDVCLNLRYPTAGESSGSLLREMALGKPAVVSDLGFYSELPNDACLKLPVGDGPGGNEEVEWLTEYLAALLNTPELREALGQAARRWAAQECSWEKVAEQYAGFLREQAEAGRLVAAVGSTKKLASPETAVPTLDREAAAEYVLSFSVTSRETDDYVRVHHQRLLRTLEITPRAVTGGGSRILEMGCYMQITPALRRFLGYQEIRGCYFGKAGRSDHKVAYSATGERFSCWIDLFDAEKDQFPYPDKFFDTVMCCELIEHLSQDPMHMMAEINRVLKPDGHLVLSTPNITGTRGLQAILHGCHPGLVHTYGVPRAGAEEEGWHNREYTPGDVRVLFENSGLELVRLETGWLSEQDATRYAKADQLLKQWGFPSDLRGDIIYAVGQKVGPVQQRYPIELYSSL